jgi:hypothetical protein
MKAALPQSAKMAENEIRSLRVPDISLKTYRKAAKPESESEGRTPAAMKNEENRGIRQKNVAMSLAAPDRQRGRWRNSKYLERQRWQAYASGAAVDNLAA